LRFRLKAVELLKLDEVVDELDRGGVVVDVVDVV
jgi:hypothetical protein